MAAEQKAARFEAEAMNAIDLEIVRLINGSYRGNTIEAVMRLRALGEIGAGLSTDDLCKLAARVTSTLADPDQSEHPNGARTAA